ncbi:alpha/beta hydrolase [Nocardia harenae]|uniref:alpha/beta hydrolase n=1 Tax=Nocardia harenae TaxID=358707 RepID=UPI00082CAC9F|nr:alpha/beta hydrolase fold domain-containing protein [Nocardia harenae]
MTIDYDPEIAEVLAAAAAQSAAQPIPPTPRGDAAALRAVTDVTMTSLYGAIPHDDSVLGRDVELVADDGAAVAARWYTPAESGSGAAVVYAHGGGMICGSAEIYDPMVRYYVESTGVPFLSVDYRLAPEHTGERLALDVFAGLVWLHEHAGELGVDPHRIALMGDSGGGGVAAGAAILARDHAVAVSRQILIYPMLDDRNVEPDPQLAATATWTYDNNFTGWHALLGDGRGGEAVSPVAAPARLADPAGLAPAYLEVGDLDIFRDETIAYASALLGAGVSCELHVVPGAPHAFEWLAPEATVGKRALRARLDAIAAG